MTGNDWNRSELLVMETLKEIKTDTKSNSRDIVSLKVDVAKIAVKVGAVSGVAASLITSGIVALWQHLR